MSNFPTEFMPKDYDNVVVQRSLESIGEQLTKVETKSDKGLQALINQLASMQEELSSQGMSLRQQQEGNQSVLPIVDTADLHAEKFILLPLVFTWTKPIELMKYPHVGGFQFFASPQKDFEPLIESSNVSISGTCESSHATILYVSASLSSVPSLTTAYKDMPWWSDMDLVGKGIKNLTTGVTATITAWVHTSPLQCTTGIAWTAGDEYTIYEVPRPRNLIGQGPLPFAFKIVSAGFNLTNQGWDGKSYYVKCRTYSRGLPRSRRYGQFTQVGTTSIDANLPAASITASPFYIANYIYVKWTPNWAYLAQGIFEFDHWKLYRTTANSTALCDDDTYVMDDNIKVKFFTDWGYSTLHPNGPEPDITYYYWVRAIDKDGNPGALSVSDSAKLGIAADPIIDSITEESTTNWFGMKNYDVVWTCAGGAEGYKVRKQKKLNGTYGLWSLPVTVNHMTDQGLIGGEDKQIHTLQNLIMGTTWKVGIQAVQNWAILGQNSNWVTQDFTVADTVSPDPPT